MKKSDHRKQVGSQFFSSKTSTRFEELESSRDVKIVFFRSESQLVDAIQEVISGPVAQNGYLAIYDFEFRPEISRPLGIENAIPLVVSKNKIKKLFTLHGLTASQIQQAMVAASNDPLFIVYDFIRDSYQFSVEIDAKGYRTVMEFGVFLRGLQSVMANVVTSIFRESRYRKRIAFIKAQRIQGLALLYEKGEGWAALATSSPTGVSTAVASATREDLFSSNHNIPIPSAKVKKREERSSERKKRIRARNK